MTLREAEVWAQRRLSERDDLLPRVRQDARHLVELATGLSHAGSLARPETALTSEQEQKLHSLIHRRLRAEPIQHLRGSQEFYGRDFLVTPDVLIPRPETEDIVTAVLEAFPDRDTPLRIADVGTGSGVLAITLALELPLSLVAGFDVSPPALAVAQRNAERLGANGRVNLVESDLLAATVPGECFDVIVSNPPYIPLGDAPALHPEVREFEPHLALFAGEDGHDIFRRLIPQAHAHLRSGGLLLLETGGRVDLIERMFADGFHDVAVRFDLQGIARIVSARRH